MEKTNLRAETELYKFDLHKRLNPLFTTHMILDHKYQEQQTWSVTHLQGIL